MSDETTTLARRVQAHPKCPPLIGAVYVTPAGVRFRCVRAYGGGDLSWRLIREKAPVCEYRALDDTELDPFGVCVATPLFDLSLDYTLDLDAPGTWGVLLGALAAAKRRYTLYTVGMAGDQARIYLWGSMDELPALVGDGSMGVVLARALLASWGEEA